MNKFLPKFFIFSFVFLLYFFAKISAQVAPKQLSASEISLELKKLHTLGTVLYLAAHPDDENTAMIAYLANERHVRTGYLSLTRGDGGQNLIGAEQRELMGLIRTQELLQARRIDGGEQFFTRANDFGFSKNAKESFEIWGKNNILADVVRIIRQFRPDVIICRFPPDRRAGHGHHEASTLLALEAFEMAGDKTKFPEQLSEVSIWQPTRLFWNAYSPNFQNTLPDSTNTISVEIGKYNALLGKSNLIIAAESRSMHKSQGFGTAKNHGLRTEYLTLLKGKPTKKDIFEDIDLSWKKIKNGENIVNLLEKIEKNYDFNKPYLITNLLFELRKNIRQSIDQKPTQNLDFKTILEKKITQIDALIKQTLGLWIDANAYSPNTSLQDTLKYELESSHQSPYKISVQYFDINTNSYKNLQKDVFEKGKLYKTQNFIFLQKNKFSTSQPYWLSEKIEKGLFQVSNPYKIGLPENLPIVEIPLQISVTFEDNKTENISYLAPIAYKYTKAEDEEIYRPLEITPAVMVNFSEKTFLFASDNEENLEISLKAGKKNVKGSLKLDVPQGWRVEPLTQDFEILQKDQEKDIIFKIFPPKNAQKGTLKALIKLENDGDNNGNTDQSFQPAKSIIRIDYRHIPLQTIFPNAEALLNRLDLKTTKKNIGYIAGAGDEIPRYLTQLGYEVSLLDKNTLAKENLDKYASIIIGVRAYNTEEHLANEQEKLKKYVENGGTLVTQYQTSQRLLVKDFAIYPLTLSRERVTVEEAPVKMLAPEHEILNTPNKITAQDFSDWVQERGLYFADTWAKEYTAILASNDPNEPELQGGLLVANHGKGKFVYTGFSFFRQIPAGVSGAIRLFVNLLD